MEPNIELAKLRDFGELIGDTFQFIRQNFKGLLKNYFIFCGFFLIAGAAVSFLQMYKMMGVFKEVSSNSPRTFGSNFSDMWLTYAAQILVLLFTYCSITVTTLCYIALYKQKGNIAPNTDEMWAYIKYYFLRVVGGTIVIGVLFCAGFVLCLLPGIYLLPILSLIFPIMIIENASFGYAFNRSFQLIKQNWWVTFGALFIIGIIVNIMSAVITLPASAISISSLLLRPQDTPEMSIGTIALSVILQYTAQVFAIIPMITISLCYFNLSENKDGTNLLDRINKFGTNGPQTNLPAEDY